MWLSTICLIWKSNYSFRIFASSFLIHLHHHHHLSHFSSFDICIFTLNTLIALMVNIKRGRWFERRKKEIREWGLLVAVGIKNDDEFRHASVIFSVSRFVRETKWKKIHPRNGRISVLLSTNKQTNIFAYCPSYIFLQML